VKNNAIDRTCAALAGGVGSVKTGLVGTAASSSSRFSIMNPVPPPRDDP
jgi:hypothetical protein